MPAWIHNRAEHLLAKNPSMDKSKAFAIATQQSHKMGKSPKGYGTKAGKKDARVKYNKPRKEYVRGANPGKLESAKMAAMRRKLAEDLVPGGKADKKTDADFPKKQLDMGQKVEMEHTNSPQQAREVARDHLTEFKDYYTRLKKMEHEAEQEKKANGADDEEGKRTLTPKDKKDISAFMKKRSPGQKDEEFHAFVEGKGMNPHAAEETVYDMLGAKMGQAFTKFAIGAAPSAYKPPPMPKPVGQTPEQRLKSSQDVGSVGAFDQKSQGVKFEKFKPVSMMKQNTAKLGFQKSQYSGPLSQGRFMARHPLSMGVQTTIRPPRAFGKTAGPPPPGEETDMNGHTEKTSALAWAARNALEAVGEWQAKQAAPMTPEATLANSQQVGSPKLTPPPGPSIAQISKPSGYGTPAPGAVKAAAMRTALLEELTASRDARATA